ncbi:hypothetical protein CRYUN_Cryun22dG0029200 [Craigia yunnanensis]
MKMTLQQFHNSPCCHQENNDLSNWCSSIYPPSRSSMEMLKHMNSLSITPSYKVSSQNICHCVDDNYLVKGHMGFSYNIMKCPCSLEEDGQNSDAADHFSKGSESIDGFGKNNAAVSMEDMRRRMICSSEDNNTGDGFLNGKDVRQSKVCARGHWKPAEDSKLKELVALCGPQNWNLIAEKLQGRTGKSCRLRWFNQLDPRINKKAFTEEEEERLIAAHRAYGNKWAMIARFFPGRTDNAVKNHWHVIMARKYREQTSAYGRRKLSQAVQRKLEENRNFDCRESANGNFTNSSENPYLASSIGSNGSYKKTTRKGTAAATSSRDLFLGSKSYNSFSPGEGTSKNHTPLDFFSDYRNQEGLISRNSRQWNMLQDETTLTVSHPSQMLMQQSKNHHQLSGFSYSIASSSHVTVTEPSSSSPSAAENTVASHFESTTPSPPPPFIDFLGVGA